MARPKSTPRYCVHKRSGRAYVTIDGRQHSLGPANTPDILAAYDRLIGQWFSNGRRLPPEALRAADVKPTGPTCSMLIEAFWQHALSYYTTPARDGHGNPITNPDGTPKLVPSKELDCYRQALRPLMRLYGSTLPAAFGCAELEGLRAAMIRPRNDPQTGQSEPGWCRTYANRQVGRIKHTFGWGVTRNLVSASVHHALMQVKGLRAGRSLAREPEPVGPVDEARALAIVPHVSAQVGAMVKVQLYTGMRSTEVCIMRPRDIDRTVTPWVYRPLFHKTQYRGIAREIPIGPKAREVLATYLDGRDPEAFIFSPAEAEQERHRRQRENRDYVPPSQVERSLRALGRKRRKAPGNRYTDGAYYKAVMWGCEQAFGMPKEYRPARTEYAVNGDPPDVVKAKEKLRRERWAKRSAWHAANGWHPHMARHRSATDLRKGGGLEVAQVVMGHTSTKTTLRYAEADVERAHAVVERIG